MAASRMSRIACHRLALLVLLVATVASAFSSEPSSTPEGIEDAEMIPAHVVFDGADGDAVVSVSPFDLKKYNSNNKKFQKFYPKTESDWNFKGEGKKTDVYIKDAKDNRLLRLISEGLIAPQDILPDVSNDAIVSSQKNVSSGEMSVTVQPEGMSGIVDDGLAADSDEKIIIEKKKNATKEKVYKSETDVSRESDENVKINLDASAGVQSPVFTKQKDSITVPAQKQISLSKGKESHIHKRLHEANFDVISLHRQKDSQPSTDEGVFDFIDTPLSNKNLVPAGTAQTSRINVKKGPNGQDYEYEYVYYYYEDPDEVSNNNGNKPAKTNEIPVSSSTPAARTTPISRHSSTPATRFNDNSATRIKSTDILSEPPSLQSQLSRDKFNVRPDYRYTIDNSAVVSPFPTAPSKPVLSNDLSWQFDQNNRFPGRQLPPQTVSEQPHVTVIEETSPTTRQSTRGKIHYNTVPPTTTDDSSYLVTAQPFSTLPPRETQTRGRSSGNVRQPGLELVDSNSFRLHSTRLPSDYEQYSTQTFENPVGKSLKQSPESTVSHNLPPVPSSTKGDFLRTKEPNIAYTADTEHFQSTSSPRIISTISTESNAENTAVQSTLSEATLTTVYGAGLTDKAAHDLYAIYQQTQNEETVRNTIAQEDRTTIVDELVSTNPPTTTLSSTTSTTTTTTTPLTTTTTTTQASVAPTVAPGRGRFRSSSPRTRHTITTTEATSSDNEASEKPRSRFQPTHRREQGHRISAYGRRGNSTTASPEGEASSSTISSAESSTRHSYSPPRTRYRGSGSLRSENTNAESTTSAPRPNFSDRFNGRRRPAGLRTTSTAAPSPSAEEEDSTQKQDVSSEASANPVDAQSSTTFRSTRNKLHNSNGQVRPLRPGAKVNFAGRSRFGATSSTAVVPLDADTSGSADVPVEPKNVEENVENYEVSSSASPATTVSTIQPDALHRLRNRPKLRISDKGSHAKAQAQQSNNTAALNQNRRQLVHNLLPRKKQPTTSTESPEVKEEVDETADSKPVAEEVAEETALKADEEAPNAQLVVEVPSTTESKLSSLLTSRRRNMSRKPGTLVQPSKQTVNEES